MKYREVTVYFLRLGLIGFGGPLALVGIMQAELIEKRKWMDPEEFKRVFALIKSMPGPVAFQTAVFLGRRRAGLLGGAIAAIFLNLPAFILLVLFGYYYQAYEQQQQAQWFLLGMQAAALTMVLIGMKSFFLPYFKRLDYWVMLLSGAAVFYYQWLPEPVLILGGASLWAARKRLSARAASTMAVFAIDPRLLQLIAVCAKAGAFVFGTGLAIVPLLENDVVEKLGWMNHAQFMDALAMGQITPGPVVITATFIGLKVLGFWGACAATVAIFAPAFFHMMTWFPYAIAFLGRQKWINDFVFAATSIIVGTLAVTTLRMMTPWQATPWCFLIFAICFAIALRTRVPSWALIPIGGVPGLVAKIL